MLYTVATLILAALAARGAANSVPNPEASSMPDRVAALVALSAANPLPSSVPDVAAAMVSERPKSRGFHLIVNVTDLHRDFQDRVHGRAINSIHIGQGHNLLGAGSAFTNPRVFYQNASETEYHVDTGFIISDTGPPPNPYRISTVRDEKDTSVSYFRLDSTGARQAYILRGDQSYLVLGVDRSQFSMCQEPLDFYGGKKYNVLKWFHNPQGLELIPKNCVPVRLLALCAELGKVAPGGFSSHKFVRDTNCYREFESIKWPED